MKIHLSKHVLLLLLIAIPVVQQLNAQPSSVPGTVIDHVPASTQNYIGSPSICILPNGNYVATHDLFGDGSTADEKGLTMVFWSRDKGKLWQKITEIHGQLWSTLFVLDDDLYLIGTTKQDGDLVIRRSTDGGKIWSNPNSSSTGLLREGHFHTAPVPVLVHDGRVWRDVEQSVHGHQSGSPYKPLMLSAPANANLLDAANWITTNPVPSDSSFLGGKFNSWLEGNAIASSNGEMNDILRVSVTKNGLDKAAIVKISKDGTTASFDPATGFIDFAGGARKFTIRYDQTSKRYWTICNFVKPEFLSSNAGSVRNTLVIKSSVDLLHWTIHQILLTHPDVEKHGFQYADWQFDGKDIIYVSRTAFDDNAGGADNYHNANYLTFHRIKNFRKLVGKEFKY